MPVLPAILGADVSKLALSLDVVDTDSSFLDYLFEADPVVLKKR